MEKTYYREYYRKNKEKLAARAAEYYRTKDGLEKVHSYKRNNYEKVMLKVARERSKTNNQEFNLELSDIQIPEVCPYLGIKLTREFGNGRVKSNPSIDRIDNSKGYVKGNIQVISELANRMKNNATIDELVLFAKGVLEKHGTNPT